jgi:hypothetical protein
MDALSPWRSVAARHGFLPAGNGGSTLLCGSTFLDLHGDEHGLEHAALKTWLDAGKARISLTTFAVAPPRTMPARLVRGVLNKLAKSEQRPMELRAPDDLRLAIEKHFRELLSIAARPVRPDGDPLEWRDQQETRDEKFLAR